MIQIVTGENRSLFHHALGEMHRQRKALFVDEMGWALECCAGLEIDEFDTPQAIYLLEIGASGKLLQSARLLPSSFPHLLTGVFPGLCPNGAPVGERIWEASRFCPAPTTQKGAPRRELLFRMIAAIMETGLLFGIERVSFVASAALAPLAGRAGWEVEALGPPQRWGGEKLTAMAASITSDGLTRVRALHGLKLPLTRFAGATQTAIAA